MRSDRPSPPRYDSAPEAFDGPWETYSPPEVRRYTFGDLWFGSWICAFAFNAGISFDNPNYANVGVWLAVCALMACVYATILSVAAFLVARIRGA